jgi:signal transduction histidine kinase/DNA-binding response OmpR family regulator
MEEGSAMRCNDGTIWFGSKEGILQFDPQKITTNKIDYPTYIVDIKVSNKDFDEWNTDSISVKYLDNITLKHNQSMFTIEFAALNYYSQNHISYRYILEGYEKEWHFNGKNRIASYTNVPPGEYLFKVRTIDDANPVLVSERALRIKILPPWWKSTGAYIVYMFFSAVFLYSLFRFITLMIKMRNDVYIEQKLSDLKIKFFTNISHELRTPLTLIKAPIQELKENENLSEKGKQYVNLMEDSTNQMLILVNQILDFRKIENKKMRLHVSPVNLNMIIKSFYDEFLVLAEESDIDYNYHLLHENIILWADKEKLETVIRNILSNAFKFTPSGGSVLVTAGIEEEKQQCFIRIEDTGIGIPQNKLDEIFERFSQSGDVQNVIYQGTGIGLALSKELVLLHHGEIKVESAQNKGSAFTVELPLGEKHFKESEVDFYISDIVEGLPDLEEEGNDEVEIEESADVQSGLPSLLLVEDNKALCNLIKLQLEDKFNVYIAHDGEEGLKKVHLYYPDVVITDQVMPTMDGLELLKQIRDDFQISHIPVILLTAKNDDKIKIQSLNLGANAYITKPFSKKHLIARIEQLLNERKLFRERFWNKDNNSDQLPDDYGKYFVEKDVDFLNKTRQIIEENLDNSDFNIDAIASSLNLSRSAFFKKLKSITGLAPVDLVKDIRLNKAVELMKKTDMSISEIAFAVGFKDAGYFGKCFKKKYKLSPRDYLNTCKK